ncbi:MAG: DUF58 domain-containing protein, partial [Phycisphaerales bacterium]|nr:DUF58 domain-containing protein [Phycisphaerales bacterium]
PPPPPTAFCLHLPSRQSATITATITAAKRGTVQLDAIRITCSFPFGFLRRAIHLNPSPSPEQLIVYPRIGTLNRRLALRYREAIESGTMTANIRGGTDEFYGLREYRAGDNIRSIHWRSSARTNQLKIREMTANAPPQAIIVLNLRTANATTDPATIEQAIELTASLLNHGILENFAIALTIAGLDSPSPHPQMGRETRAHLLRQLAILDINQLTPTVPIALPNRFAGRAEWIIITLHHTDPFRDLLPPGPATSFTLLALDAPDAATWLRFSSTLHPL